ncbi:MAG: betaine-aldehyde dehydrogenase [Actinomycetota bacterium]|jgi:betaine-aldehyde dehydrogenase|nr:betaine-aldehyde dehydrogenase [Actinomycetota bacterium]
MGAGVRNLYIDGAWTTPQRGQGREIVNPFDRSVVAKVAEGDGGDARKAIAAARRAFDTGPWPRTPAAQRGRMVMALADLVERDTDELARLETLDTGKTLTESAADMADVASVLRYFAGLADKDGGFVVASPVPHSRSVVVREPVGVCGQISPWNYPLLQASWKLAPALAAGNTVVVKPSEITPMSTIKLFELVDEVGFPPGVANLVLGPGPTVGNELAASNDVDMISFTGGIATGKTVMQAASANVKRIALELGGKNPNIVFADADFQTAVDYALMAVFFHSGQVCSAGARLLIQEPIHDAFVAEVCDRVARIRLGNGLDAATESGPMISAGQRDKVERYVQIGIAEGATLAVGGQRPTEPRLQAGFFFQPTVFTDCHNDMRIVQEEIFGPVLTVERFATEAEVVQRANSTIYGLAGAVWTNDANRAQRVSRALRLGTVWINDYHPYFAQAEWGGFKQSGIGRELGRQGLEEYTEVKHVFANLDPRPMHWFKG